MVRRTGLQNIWKSWLFGFDEEIGLKFVQPPHAYKIKKNKDIFYIPFVHKNNLHRYINATYTENAQLKSIRT